MSCQADRWGRATFSGGSYSTDSNGNYLPRKHLNPAPRYIFEILWIFDPGLSYFCLSSDLRGQVATVKSQMPELERQNNIILIILISMSNNKSKYFSLLGVHEDCISR